MIAQITDSPMRQFPTQAVVGEYPHPEHLPVFKRIYEAVEALSAEHTGYGREKRQSAEERGKRFAIARYGIDPEVYMAEVCSIDCATFVTSFASRDLNRWKEWKKAWEAGECRVDPVMWAQIAWAMLYPFSDRFHKVEEKGEPHLI